MWTLFSVTMESANSSHTIRSISIPMEILLKSHNSLNYRKNFVEACSGFIFSFCRIWHLTSGAVLIYMFSSCWYIMTEITNFDDSPSYLPVCIGTQTNLTMVDNHIQRMGNSWIRYYKGVWTFHTRIFHPLCSQVNIHRRHLWSHYPQHIDQIDDRLGKLKHCPMKET